MTFALVFLVNAGLSFALSFVVAGLIGPDAFGRYAIALAVSIVVNTIAFEWLRLSTTRFGSDRARAADPAIEATLRAAYAATAVLLVAGTALVLLAVPDAGLPRPLLAAAIAAGLAIGLFDRRSAEARARFEDRRYAALLLARGVLAFGLAAGAAAILTDPVAILLASGAAAFLAMAIVRDRRIAPPPAGASRTALASFARYAIPLVAASALYQLLPLLNRSVLAGRAGFSEAAYLALAGEIAVRLFQNLGSALDLALFQLAVRAEERDGPAAGTARAGRNLAIVAAILLPAAAGLAVVWPAFESLLVPPAFRGQVSAAALLSIPAFAAYALVQYGLNPIFQLGHRTGMVVTAAAVALLVDGALLVALPEVRDAAGLAAIQLASLCGALLVLAGLALRTGAVLPWRDLAGALLATGLMVAALWPWRDALPPLAALPAQSAAGVSIYAALAVALDVAGARGAAAATMRRLRRG